MDKKPVEALFKPDSIYTMYEFMSLVIPYYYNNNRVFGAQGDFITAPEVSQTFGELIGAYIAYNWQQMGSPSNINIIEFGAGLGTLMKDFLRGTENVDKFHNSLNLHIVETSESLINQQESNILLKNATWHNDISSIPEGINFYIGNEFFDALPIKQYLYQDSKWYEVAVKFDRDLKTSRHLIETSGTLQDIFSKKYQDIKSGGVIELNQVSISILQDIINNVKTHKGGALFIDYGYLDASYKDTLQAVKNHKYHYIFDDIGEADITSHVDFGSLVQVLYKNEINDFYYNTQREFLLSLGIYQRMEVLKNNVIDVFDKKLIDLSVQKLIGKDKMGELFKVLSFFKY